ncbi:PQQ-binding-like beta-propeller repeat protein [Natrinema sp. H-ect4]|uniref:outer membrane protein assembly factor BamB family protein n=1 Tax=Natrinema sp. H-ect4 TaxID=3242699 RepID=UPI0035A998A8
MAAQSPQPTAHEPEPGCTLNRRDFAKAVGMAAAIGAGGAASSGTASATVSGLTYMPGAPTVTGLLFAEALGSAGFNEDPTRDKITLHNQATGAKAWWDTTLDMIRDSRLEDAAMVANIEARAAYADEYEAGGSQSECRDAALQAISEFFNTPAKNATETVASALSEIGYAAEAARADSDIDDRFIAFTIGDSDYSGSGSVDESGSQVNDASNPVTHTVELPTGDTHEVDAPDLSHAWDNGDSITITLGDVQSGYDDTNEEVVLTTDSDNEVTSHLPITVMSVPDADLVSETVLVLEEWADVMDEIQSLSSEVRGNYGSTLSGDLYDALDNGDISPSDVRGIEGIASHLSGSTDATSSRYQMALMNQLGLSRNDLSNVASMTATYSGYTGREINRSSGKISSVELTDEEDGLQMEGQLFADLLGDTTLSSGQTYYCGPKVLNVYQSGTVACTDAYTGVTYWEASLGNDAPDGFGASSDGSRFAVSMVGQLKMYQSESQSLEWTWDPSQNPGSVALPSDGSAAYAIRYGGELEKIVDGSSQWSTSIYSSSSYDYGIDVSPDDETIVVGNPDGELTGLDTTGSETFSYSGLGGVNAVETDGETSYVAHSDGVAAVDYEGNELWTTSPVATGGDCALSGSRLYVADDSDDSIYALNAEDGTEIWQSTFTNSGGLSLSLTPSGTGLNAGDSAGDTHVLSTADGTAKRSFSHGGGIYDLATLRPDTEADGDLGRAVFFDVVNGEEHSLYNGTVTIDVLTNKDGETIDEGESFEWDQPDHDATDMTEYRDQVEETSEEHKDAIAEEEENDGPGPIFGSGNPLEGGGGLLGLGIIGVVILAVIGIVTDAIPGLGN